MSAGMPGWFDSVTLAAALGMVAGLAGLRWLIHGLILRGLRAPRVVHGADFAACDAQGRAVRVPGEHGKSLFAWFSPALGPEPTPAVLVMHGWGANAAMMLPCLAPLKTAGFAVLLVDARCHGHSDDEPFTSMPRFAQDIASGLNWLISQPQIDANRLALIGHSVGAGAALLCAGSRGDVGAVVSISAFAHPQEVMRRFLAEKRIPYPVLGWYVLRHVQRVIGNRFDAIAPVHTIAQVRCPVLLVHGSDDETVPFDDARRIQSAAGPQRVQLLGVPGRHDPSDALQEELPRIVDFLQQALRQKS